MRWWPFSPASKALEPVNSPEEQTLSDIIRGITHSAVSAHDIVDQQFQKTVQKYFDVDAKGVFHAKFARVAVSDTQYMDVPLITMIDPKQLQLDEMEVRLGVRLTKAQVKQAVKSAADDPDKGTTRSAFNVSLVSANPNHRHDVIDVTMKFKRADAVEATSRLNDELCSNLTPKPFTDSDTKQSPPTGMVSAEDRGTDEFRPSDLT